MKHSIFFALVLFCYALPPVQAQSDTMTSARTSPAAETYTMPTIADTTLKAHGQAVFGIKVGLVRSTLYGEHLADISKNGAVEPLLGFQMGISVNSMMTENLWLKHEFYFQQMGANITIDDNKGAYPSTLHNTFLTLFPASVAFHWNGAQVYGGGYVSMLLAASIRRKDSTGTMIDDTSIFGDPTETTEENKYLQKFDAGIVLGIEYEFAFGLNLGIRYTQGFVPIFDNANVHTFGQDRPVIGIYRSGLHATLGFSFR